MTKKVIILTVLALALFVRVYRIDQLLGFYYDQGRDGLVIWNLWHNHKFFLIGPTTGIEGVFRGPWYYWFIAPAYLLGHGNPVWPSIFLSLTTVFAIAIIYKLGYKLGGFTTGVTAAIISAFSFNLVLSSRWLSNPTPMWIISMGLVWAMYQSTFKKTWAWPLIGFFTGMAMQFGSAAEVFYIPAIGVWILYQRKKLPPFKTLLLSVVLFGLAFLPQTIFDVRHQGVLLSAIKNFLITDQSFKPSFWETVSARLPFYMQVFFSKLWPINFSWARPSLLFALTILVLYWRRLWAHDLFKICLILIISPVIGILFFQGNHGNVYDYYFTGYYLVFVLLFSGVITSTVSSRAGKLIVALFLVLFIHDNIKPLRNYLRAGTDGPTHITLAPSLAAVDWLFTDTTNRPFNVDVYVPPVVPYAYDYLVLWRGETKYHRQPDPNLQALLYTLYETDPPHPERLEAWMARQKGIGQVEAETSFGGVHIQRRQRINP